MVRNTLLAVAAVVGLSASTQAAPLKAGDVIILECLGHNAMADGNRFLDGNTGAGKVGLAPKTGGVFTGTKWRVVDLGNGLFGFECDGAVNGNRWLDGNTETGKPGLAPRTGGVFSGTKWQVVDKGNGVIQLFCRGAGPGTSRWLDGVTANGTTRLSKNDKPSGTQFKIHKLN
jgi:hypothetical protein